MRHCDRPAGRADCPPPAAARKATRTSAASPCPGVFLLTAVAAALMAVAPPAPAASACPGAGGGSLITVSGTDTSACHLQTGDVLTVTGSGSITVSAAGVDAVRVDQQNPARIDNQGTIRASGQNASGIRVLNSQVDTLSNLGTISASPSEALVFNASTLNSLSNHGTISAANIGIVSYSSHIGSLGNSDTISGGVFGIQLVTTAVGSLTNNGTIAATTTGHTAIYVHASSSIASLVNDGSISGPSLGILLDDSTIGNLINRGTIASTSGGYAIFLFPNSAITNGITIAGNDTARFIGTVHVPNTNVNVDAAAVYTLQGGEHFSMAGGTFTNQGTLGLKAVGSGATGTITGDFANTGLFKVHAGSSTNYGRLRVTGTATLAGRAYVDVAGAETLAVGQTLSGVVSAATLNGNFSGVDDNSALFNFRSVVRGNAIDLEILQGMTALQAVTATGNAPAQGAAAVFDSLMSGAGGDMGRVITALGTMPGEAELSRAISQALPLMQGALPRTALGVQGRVGRIVQARQEGDLGLSSGDGFADRHLWLKPFGSWGSQNDRNGATGYDSRTGGVALGADGALSPRSRLGASVAYAGSKVNSNDNLSTATVDSILLSLYGASSLSNGTEFHWQTGYGMHRTEGTRSLPFMNRIARSDYRADGWRLGAGLRHSMALSERTSLTPGLRLDYDTLRDAAYTETGAGALNLAVDARTSEQLVLGASVKLDHALDERTHVIADLGLGHDFMARRNSLTSAFVGGGAAFTTQGVEAAPTVWRGGLGYVANAARGLQVTARYDAEGRPSGLLEQTASVRLRWLF